MLFNVSKMCPIVPSLFRSPNDAPALIHIFINRYPHILCSKIYHTFLINLRLYTAVILNKINGKYCSLGLLDFIHLKISTLQLQN